MGDIQAYGGAGGPDAAVKALDRLVGTWRVTGGAEGTVTYRWLAGGHFLIQDVDLAQDGVPIRGVEMIGRLRPFMAEEPSEHIHSRYYAGGGETLDYVYELEGDTLTIWAMEKDSPAYYRGTFSPDGNTVTGAWHYPGGGGYDSTMTRLR
ncbi:hypothetical protein [Bailinhaonella thermotolerans]|uniref:DUF1579 domain-containing protein n=1 Tax=Bailinhaonella thermotolerans TaxID=1070861 RepID=A0A3A4AJ57_9ACTN|nr:hypothetical protein [Bailinhaonella thermotolerans]RJL27104.1 hypothetical protein D5H75_25150 [Bailinhaonella thermotolerans]